MSISPPVRSDVLLALWKDYDTLKNLREAVEQNKKQVTPALKFQVYVIQTQASLCRAILQGLTDQELELRVKELESKLQNSILIPKGEPTK